MNLFDQISEDIKKAMLARNHAELEALRGVKKEFLEAHTAKLEKVLRDIIAQVGATSPQEMGKVMGVATKQLAGKADGRAISETVKRLLTA